jgi:hypothetical protein
MPTQVEIELVCVENGVWEEKDSHKPATALVQQYNRFADQQAQIESMQAPTIKVKVQP